MAKHAVCIPYYGGGNFAHLACVNELKKMGTPVLEVYNVPYIEMARGALAELALSIPDVDVVMWIDHDIIFQPDQVQLIVDHVRASEYSVLGALYGARRSQTGILGRPTAEQVTFYAPGLCDASYLGMGFTAVKREVFDELAKVLPLTFCPTVKREIRPYFMSSVLKDGYHGEDISFCRRAQSAGFLIGVDLEPRIFHCGEYHYALEDSGIAVPSYETLNVTFAQGGTVPDAQVLEDMRRTV